MGWSEEVKWNETIFIFSNGTTWVSHYHQKEYSNIIDCYHYCEDEMRGLGYYQVYSK